jgi:hypothetical protein
MTPILGILDSAKYGALHAGNYYSIATATVTSGGVASGSLQFTSIPQTFTHLQIRAFASKASSGGSALNLAFNTDNGTQSNYNSHFILANGSTVSAGTINSGSAYTSCYGGWNTYMSNSNMYSVSITDILDYTNTNKYKTVRALSGNDANGSGAVFYASGLYLSTNAINTITFFNEGSEAFSPGTVIALYGVK